MARAGLLPDAVWRRLPVEGIFRVNLPMGGSFLYSATPNDGIARALFWRDLKEWERETIPIFYRIAKYARCVVDVGANTGFYTMLACAANPESRVIAFEPVPRVYAKLCEHIRLNGWESRCDLRCEAVSDTVGTTKFHVPLGDVPTSASLHLEGFRGIRGILMDVPTTTLDLALGTQPVDLVKIDVEGFEDKVLEGMQRVLASSAPTLVVECLPDGPFQRVEEILAGLGYRFYHLRGSGPVPVQRIIPDNRMEHQNFLCVCREKEWLL